MSITTYAELQTAVADFLNRDDLTATIPTFIALAEADIARRVKHWKQEKRVTTTFDERYENLPNDFLQALQLKHDGGPRIQTVSSADMEHMRDQSADTGGKPLYVRLTANQFELYPTPDEAYSVSLLYRARIPALSDAATSNWLLDDAPDVLLYGALAQSAPYLKDDGRTQVWAAFYQAGIDGLNAESKSAMAAGPVRMGVPR